MEICFDPQIGPEVADVAGELAAEAPGRGLQVAADRHQHLRVLGDVVEQVVGRHGVALDALSPHMLGAPVPALPAVGVAHGLRIAAHLLHQQHLAGVGTVHALGLAVAVTVAENGVGPVGLAYPLDLAGDEGGRLVPGDAPVLALAPVLDVALARWDPSLL